MSDDVPDLEEIEEGDEVRVFYTSQRSRNEVSRSGYVDLVKAGSNGPVVYVHTDSPAPLKQVYVALVDATTKSGDDCVAAYSATVEPDESPLDEDLDLWETYRFTMEIGRTSVLGAVDRIVTQADRFVMTDGGAETWRLICPECEARRFHDETDASGQRVACRSCGDEAVLEDRKATSRNRDPNPDREQPTLQQFGEEGQR